VCVWMGGGMKERMHDMQKLHGTRMSGGHMNAGVCVCLCVCVCQCVCH